MIPTDPITPKELRDLPKKILAPSLPAVPDAKEEEKQVIASLVIELELTRQALDLRLEPEHRGYRKASYRDVINRARLVLEEPGAVEANTVQGQMGRNLFSNDWCKRCKGEGFYGWIGARVVCPDCCGTGWKAPSMEPKGPKSSTDPEFSQTPFETGGRNALNLQMAMTLLREARCPNPHDVPTYDCPWCLAVKALQSAQAASDGKEQGTPVQTKDLEE